MTLQPLGEMTTPTRKVLWRRSELASVDPLVMVAFGLLKGQIRERSKHELGPFLRSVSYIWGGVIVITKAESSFAWLDVSSPGIL